MQYNESIKLQELETATYRESLRSINTQVVYTARREPEWITDFEEFIQGQSGEPLQVWLVQENIEQLPQKLIGSLHTFGMPDTLAHLLIEDVQLLVRFFADLTGDKFPFVSLRTIDANYYDSNLKSVSRNWHVDTSVLTLSTIYSGKGTEWIVGTENMHGYFEHEKILQATYKDLEEAEIHSMAPFEVSVLKGEIRAIEDQTSEEFLRHFLAKEETRPFNEGRGLIHRGPGYAEGDTRRLLLTVSTMRIPDWMSDT